MRPYLVLVWLVLALSSPNVLAQDNAFSNCLQEQVLSAAAETTVAELRNRCKELTSINHDKVNTAAEERLASEQAVATNEFSLLTHRGNYLLPFAYNFKAEENEVLNLAGDTRPLDPAEFKFQLSFKTLVWDEILDTRAQLYAAYTNESWWQAYNRDESSPFRETNHQPEIFVDMPTGLRLGTWELDNVRLGVSHQSNGRSGDFSRTWNRIFAEFIVSNEYNEIRFMPWKSISDIEDNPDIEDFRGRFELAGTHHISDHTLAWKARHTLDSNSRGSIQIDWSFPIGGRDDVMFLVQYFDGYGESLIDYDIKIRRLGLGFQLGY